MVPTSGLAIGDVFSFLSPENRKFSDIVIFGKAENSWECFRPYAYISLTGVFCSGREEFQIPISDTYYVHKIE